jgi:hypothetical protein
MFLNQILKETQGSIKDIQNTGAPPWFSQADNNGVLMNYPLGARVWHEDAEWISEINNNNAEPGTLGASWIRTSQIMDRIFINDDVLTTGRDLTASDINKHLIFNNTLPQTFTLPPANSSPSGSVICVRGGQSVATFNCAGSDRINVNNGQVITSCSCLGSEAIMLVSNGGADWRLTKINPRYQYVDLTASRAYNTTYTNQTGFELEVLLTFNPPSAANTSVFPFVDGVSIQGLIHNNTISRNYVSFKVPPNSTYLINVANLTVVFAWIEYRAVF